MGVEDAANAVLDALRRGEPYDRWLLIFDNADQPDDIRDVIPQGPGHVLITSRNHRWEGVVDAVPVDVFTREESVAFLNKRVRKSIPQRTPTGSPTHWVTSRWRSNRPVPSRPRPACPSTSTSSCSTEHTSQLLGEGKPTEYPVSMTAAWGLSVSRLSERMPGSGRPSALLCVLRPGADPA